MSEVQRLFPSSATKLSEEDLIKSVNKQLCASIPAFDVNYILVPKKDYQDLNHKAARIDGFYTRILAMEKICRQHQQLLEDLADMPLWRRIFAWPYKR